MSKKRDINLLIDSGGWTTEEADSLKRIYTEKRTPDKYDPEGKIIPREASFVEKKQKEIDDLQATYDKEKAFFDDYDTRRENVNKALSAFQEEWNELESRERSRGLETFFTRDATGKLGMTRMFDTLFNTYDEGHELSEGGFGGEISLRQKMDKLREERTNMQSSSPYFSGYGQKTTQDTRYSRFADMGSRLQNLKDNLEIFETDLKEKMGSSWSSKEKDASK